MKISIISTICFTILLERYVSGQQLNKPSNVRIQNRGYSSETHNITTKDGYILTLFRIKVKNKSANESNTSSPTQRPVVLMMHGMASSSDAWLIGKEDKVLSFNLVDSGYDVWLGNGRGDPYSKRHVSMKPEETRFWRFSWHEIGVIDLPATIDYILNVTHQSSMHYVGHSQGCAVFFVLLSTQPEYNDKIKSSHLFAPVAYMKNARSVLLRLAGPIFGTYSLLDPLLGDSVFLQQPLIREMLNLDVCTSPTSDPKVCGLIFYTITGGISGYIEDHTISEIFDTHPASCSAHQPIHLVQLSVSGHFRPYDFGVSGNLKRYGRSTPPDYELENINTRFPIHLYYSDYDLLSSKKDVERLSQVMGNKTVKHFVDVKQFCHIDFLFAPNAKEVVYDDVLERINEVEMNVTQYKTNDL